MKRPEDEDLTDEEKEAIEDLEKQSTQVPPEIQPEPNE